MPSSRGPRPPAHYRLRVQERLDDHWAAWFGDLTLTQESDGTTTLSGPVSDQAALHGLLTKVRDLGITLLSLEATRPPDEPATTARDHPSRSRSTGVAPPNAGNR